MDAQSLGRFFRQTREAKELTLEDAERALRIRRRVLESFELGDFNIPDASVVQIRGFIRNYARYLGLEEDLMVQYYEADRLRPVQQRGGKYANRTEGKRRKKQDTQPVPQVVAPRAITDTNPALPPVQFAPPRETRGSGGTVFGALFRLLVAGAALAVIVFVVLQLTQTPEGGGVFQPPGQDIFDQLPPSPTFTPAPTITQLALLPTALPENQTAFAGQGVLVQLEMTQRSWLRIVTDGVEQYAGIAEIGTRIEIPASQSVGITASNAEALSLTWNGQPQGSFGERGQRVDLVFTPNNREIISGPAFEPTSPFTPTFLPTDPVNVGAALAQLTPSNTPGPSPTPTLSPTPSDTPTITPIPSETPVPSETPTETAIPTETQEPTVTATPSSTPTITRTPTATPIPTATLTPTPTAILPLRVLPEDPTPTKEGA